MSAYNKLLNIDHFVEVFEAHQYFLKMTSEIIKLKSPADFHVHLRQDEMCSLVTPLVRAGGFKLAYVMVPLSSSFSKC